MAADANSDIGEVLSAHFRKLICKIAWISLADTKQVLLAGDMLASSFPFPPTLYTLNPRTPRVGP